MAYFNNDGNNQHPQSKSWENCYIHFQTKHLNNEVEIRQLDSLQLGFYLASWGMYCRSSFLLQNSYEIHTPVLQLIMEPRFEQLWGHDFVFHPDEGWLNCLFSLKEEIVNKYRAEIIPNLEVSDTLVTKIILGVLGITPGYDSLFKYGCQIKDIRPYTNFSLGSFKRLLEFYLDNIESFNRARNQIMELYDTEYPAMKLIDMYFWTIGYNNNHT